MAKQTSKNTVPALIDYSQELRSLFGKPPLLANEDPAAYEASLSNFGLAVQPRDAVEYMLVKDVNDLNWDIQRMRRAKAAMIDVSQKEGLRSILESVLETESLQGRDRMLEADLKSDDWYTKPQIRQELTALLQRYQLSEAAIPAQAMALRLRELEKVETMIASAEMRRNAALRELRVYRDSFGPRLYGEAEIIEDDETERLDESRRLGSRQPENIHGGSDLAEADQ